MPHKELIPVVYVPETPAFPGEHYLSYKEYKLNNSDVWEDENGEWRLPQYNCMTLDEFKSGIRDVQVV